MAVTKLISPESLDQTLQVDQLTKGIDAMKDNAGINFDNFVERAESTLRNFELNSIENFASPHGRTCPAY